MDAVTSIQATIAVLVVLVLVCDVIELFRRRSNSKEIDPIAMTLLAVGNIAAIAVVVWSLFYRLWF